MPIVRTKKAIDAIESGQVLEVHVTDKGAIAGHSRVGSFRWSHYFRAYRRR